MAAETREPSPIDVAVGARIRQLREARNISQKELGQQVGLTHQQFRKYEAGENRISAGRLWEIAKILRTTIVYFYEGIDPVPARVRRGMAEEAADFAGQPSDEASELAVAFDRIEDEEVRSALAAEVKKQAWAARRQR
ncbi:MAG: helix-turn-helix domain-containing protein [Hyphomonadaceae bacterium]